MKPLETLMLFSRQFELLPTHKGGLTEKIIETKRLYLRELDILDLDDLSKILSDSESMKYYPHLFSREEVRKWIEWNIDNYIRYNHGLWAVILKENGTFLGDCGITVQEIENSKLPELGYHIHKDYCNKGFATEAAKACIDYAFNTLNIEKLYTYTDILNIPSRKVAEKNGMKLIKNFSKEVMGYSIEEVLYSIGAINDM